MIDNLQKALVDATHKVFNLMLNVSEISDHPAENFKYDDEVDIAVSIAGDLYGKVIYRFPVPTSLNMVRIMSGMQFEEVDVFVTSALSEIANIISGNALTALSDTDVKCDILPPVQCKLDDDNGYGVKRNCCICTPIGEICLEIRMKRDS
ncbi:MAG TPA: chemotaxis protein CheX [Clostridiaceae bacterium]|jgi:chemotaxis protein CheX|nr:chemotaxis protein CheX [Clostridiaceae bacterium]